MAVNRTILPRKGLIQPQHGLTGYEADQDANWALLDANVAFVSDLQHRDLGLNGVVSGFVLGVTPSLTPSLTPGVLYAQGVRYAPASPPVLGPAPANSTSYLFYNSSTGFYYQSSALGAAAGDALIGQVVTTAAVSAVTGATRLYGQLPVTATAAGNWTVAHLLGRPPVGAVIQMTSPGSIWFQRGVLWDATTLYLAASAAGVTAMIQLW